MLILNTVLVAALVSLLILMAGVAVIVTMFDR